MDKEQNQNSEEVEINNTQETSLEEEVNKDKKKDPEERILELEDKLGLFVHCLYVFMKKKLHVFKVKLKGIYQKSQKEKMDLVMIQYSFH